MHAAAIRTLADENAWLRSELHERLAFPRILGSSPVLAETFRRIRALAAADTPVLLVGEPGTGKKLLARAIHHLGPRWRAPLVSVERGTPAESWTPRLGFAAHGTLFVESLDLADPRDQDTIAGIARQRRPRLVASAGHELTELDAAVVPVPPLRARDGDVVLLAAHFLEAHRLRQRRGPLRLASESVEALRAHPWPGNVRELDRCIERAVLVAEGDSVEPRHLALSHRPPAVR